MKDASKKDAELFNLKSFKKGRNSSTNAKENMKTDSLMSPNSSIFKVNRYKGNNIKEDESSPSQMKFGSLKLFPTKETNTPRSKF